MASQHPSPSAQAAHLAALHVPGNPLVIPNIWDLSSLNAVLSLNAPSSPSPSPSPAVRAVATASYAIAASLGLADADLSLGANLIRTRQLAPRVRAAGLPLTVDLQDGYGARLDDAVRAAVEAGAVGANIEDLRDTTTTSTSNSNSGDGDGDDDALWPLEEQVARLRRAAQVAADAGCAGFVLNARCDVLSIPASGGRGGDDDAARLREAVRRGRAYLDAGATTVFVWGGARRGLRDAEVRALVAAFGGRLAVKLADGPGALTVAELAALGVARISVGPSLYLAADRAVREAAERIVQGGRL
ncbi:putative carboxyphosphonoenolpyruvate phosphonomutase-like protein [Rosellinia necatrix]|uniref:Putative carboxyphosphonoenolpyruvate phosphonomutase-like protein n=1 Tax=Rosellinia necatrix TaxID=77044 RepID=A0A1W2TF23_ROSNE|nr:putative carboxyphosphonoenolpyruvate phosphonomutase-like protein [Rosellinia necatrix]